MLNDLVATAFTPGQFNTTISNFRQYLSQIKTFTENDPVAVQGQAFEIVRTLNDWFKVISGYMHTAGAGDSHMFSLFSSNISELINHLNSDNIDTERVLDSISTLDDLSIPLASGITELEVYQGRRAQVGPQWQHWLKLIIPTAFILPVIGIAIYKYRGSK